MDTHFHAMQGFGIQPKTEGRVEIPQPWIGFMTGFAIKRSQSNVFVVKVLLKFLFQTISLKSVRHFFWSIATFVRDRQ